MAHNGRSYHRLLFLSSEPELSSFTVNHLIDPCLYHIRVDPAATTLRGLFAHHN
jgi:hypothetical protein